MARLQLSALSALRAVRTVHVAAIIPAASAPPILMMISTHDALRTWRRLRTLCRSGALRSWRARSAPAPPSCAAPCRSAPATCAARVARPQRWPVLQMCDGVPCWSGVATAPREPCPSKATTGLKQPQSGRKQGWRGCQPANSAAHMITGSVQARFIEAQRLRQSASPCAGRLKRQATQSHADLETRLLQQKAEGSPRGASM